MLAFIVSTVRKVLGFFAVADDGYKIKLVDETADSQGLVADVVDAYGNIRSVFLHRCDGRYDLSSSAFVYVKYKIVRDRSTHAYSQAKITFFSSSKGRVTDDDYKALVRYFNEQGINFTPRLLDEKPTRKRRAGIQPAI